MLEALWSVEFSSNLGMKGAGVAVFETGRVLGGDSSYYYVGDAEVVNSILRAKLEVTHYSGPRNSVVGNYDRYHLEISGPVNRNQMILQGHVVEDPRIKMAFRLTRRAELP